MKFIDTANIHAKAGKGGAGSRSFRREAMVPYGGPDGGDGGKGGSIVLIANRNVHTLLDFKFQPLWRAEDGGAGHGARKSGKSGEDLIIKVPMGTEVFREGTDELVIDLTEDGQQFVLCKGGRGGKGNDFFKSATNRAPDYAQPGEEGEEGNFTLSLKLVADVGLVGFPNAGKSTLISRISAARPKIADYPFTTLTPQLGVVQGREGFSFVVADIPGLIPGAHEGKGLGITFLKHIERTRLIAHLIDVTALDDNGEQIEPLNSFQTITQELSQYSAHLAALPQIIVLTKADIHHERDHLQQAKSEFEKHGYDCVIISSSSGEGITELTDLIARRLKKL